MATPSPDDPSTPAFDPLGWDFFCVGSGVFILALGAILAIYGFRVQEVPRYAYPGAYPTYPPPYAPGPAPGTPWAPAPPAPPGTPPGMPPGPEAASPAAPAATATCRLCGSSVDATSKFCTTCGAPMG